MKILITTDAYYPMINGVVVSTNNLYKQLKMAGHDVRILTLSYNGREYIEGDIYYLNSHFVKVYPDARIMKPFGNKVISKIVEWSPEIIHSQTEFSTMLVAKYIKRKLDIPQVHTYHTMYEDYLKYFLGGKVIRKGTMAKLLKILLNTFDEIIAPTEKVKNVLREYEVYKDIKIVPTGIDIKSFQKELSSKEREKILNHYGWKTKDKILVYVGRVAEEKNIDEIINLFKKGLNELKDIKLLIVGGGPYLSQLKELVSRYGIEDIVKFTGMVDSDQVYKYYKMGIAFVTASQSETQGLTYIEALASGCPVICKWDPCIKNLIVNGVTGFAYTDTSEFVKAVESLKSNEILRRKIISNAKQKSCEYSTENFGKSVMDIYNKVLLGRNVKKRNLVQIIRTIF
ncbi:1,2-diacylglycerol 3-alpha-glucosyltransferase [Clostridium acetobutylicum]|uniref:Glycosyltransferase n=1 Tax=Clostridium acetobutylicum (strain ATCC 824 / DSM 792 / JCM 1419 / IAM 19013 / LMG 5710 / NBRC 13948 / NRRL B-527 / VKM B-1787 / 2291 / W) TaxID=272562 RepID=Q97D86_CLOAB|nr:MULTISPECIES: glycosyltransferase family 4 protein [Clostridium]AAK81517.1 Glycosyltransferase [Clostridium acetobutylicum ATCC 824]ADZ22638.1 Glycosyltransferase [Clostridium acetobutylicum EA 2018]AEI32946.1 glycosyltransferase [Clostridium acetobutylicum DSM 1731]AWV80809.1 glycosyltransferase family 4 protein [Clostridium acetobutylicum]MBC2393865.1 glycosyltransferase family 4 protein [Clostridium acetobutylicum]